MIKKVIGILIAIAVIVVIVFATMNRDKYRSMLEERAAERTETPAKEPADSVLRAQPPPAAETDSLALDRE